MAMKIYTRTGDAGTTGIHGGSRVPKDDIRIEANGCIDELNSMIGIVRSMLPEGHDWQEKLFSIQKELMVVMSHVATPNEIRHRNPNQLNEGLVSQCEAWMDCMTEQLSDNGYFLVPGGTPLAAHLQYARTLARRAERRMWTLNRQDSLPECTLKLMNRLSDLFFVMARYELQQQSWPEEKWQKFAYKNRK